MNQYLHHRSTKRRRAQAIENLVEEIIMENFPILVKEIGIQAQEVQRFSDMMKPERPTPRHVIIKMSKVKDKVRILKVANEI